MRKKTLLTTLLLMVFGTGCSGFNKVAKKPHPMEYHFSHVVFNHTKEVYPSLRQPAAPKKATTPRRAPSGEVTSKQSKETLRPKTAGLAGGSEATIRVNPAFDNADDDPLGVHGDRDEEPTAKVPAVPKRPKAPKKTEAGGLDIQELAPAEPSPKASPGGLGDGSISGEMLAAAQRLVGIKSNYNEVGLLTHLLQVADVGVEVGDHPDLVKALYERLNQKDKVFGPTRRPKVGDLVFFHNTYDRDGDGRADDWFTMCGVVEKVRASGTVTFIGFARRGVRRMSMNLERPAARRDEAKSADLNSLLRAKKLTDRPFTAYLAGELYASYARID